MSHVDHLCTTFTVHQSIVECLSNTSFCTDRQLVIAISSLSFLLFNVLLTPRWRTSQWRDGRAAWTDLRDDWCAMCCFFSVILCSCHRSIDGLSSIRVLHLIDIERQRFDVFSQRMKSMDNLIELTRERENEFDLSRSIRRSKIFFGRVGSFDGLLLSRMTHILCARRLSDNWEDIPFLERHTSRRRKVSICRVKEWHFANKKTFRIDRSRCSQTHPLPSCEKRADHYYVLRFVDHENSFLYPMRSSLNRHEALFFLNKNHSFLLGVAVVAVASSRSAEWINDSISSSDMI